DWTQNGNESFQVHLRWLIWLEQFREILTSTKKTEYEGKHKTEKLEELGNMLTGLDAGDSIGDFADEKSAITESDIEETFKRLVTELKKSPQELFDALKKQTVNLVLTAHPTQSVRRSLLQKYGSNGSKDVYLMQIQAAFRTDEIRRSSPTPQDEMRAGMSYFHETIWKGVPKFLRRVDTALKNIGINERVPYNAPLIQFSSWMGGDRDGNPRVTPEVTRDVCFLARMMAANLYFSQIEDLMFELSMWRCNDELRVRADELHVSSRRDAKHYIEFWKQIPLNEPYCVILGDVRDKLYNTYERARQLLANGTSDIPEETTFTNVEQVLSSEQPYKLQSPYGQKYVECLLSVSKKLDVEGEVTGVFCFLQTASPELQQALHIQRLSEQTSLKRLKALTYMKRQIRNLLCGNVFSRKLLENAELGIEQKQLLHTGTQWLSANASVPKFSMTRILTVMKKSKAMGIHIINEVMEHIMTETLYGDSLRLQQVLVDFLLICINFMPTGGQVVVAASLTKDQLGKSVHLANLEISITHDGVGVPETLLNQMFRRDRQESEEGISLLISRKLLKRMNGDVQYLREAGKSSFILIVELAAS
ncbi:hypothetical protein S83_001496, partial [Arachis hypogaea]